MNAGRELDCLIAERVMGWTRPPKYPALSWIDGKGKELDNKHGAPGSNGLGDYYYPHREWSPSTDIQAAWEVVEKIPGFCISRVERGSICVPRHLVWAVSNDFQDFKFRVLAEAETAPLAICLAALERMGIKSE